MAGGVTTFKREDISDLEVVCAYEIAKAARSMVAVACRHAATIENVTLPSGEVIDVSKRSPYIWPEDVLMAQRPGLPCKVAFAAMDRAFTHGLIDYGTSLRSGWVTQKAKDLVTLHMPPITETKQ